MLSKFRQRTRIWVIVSAFLFSLSWAMSAGAVEGKVDLNTASVKELQSLKGIGKILAERIVEYREKNGPFTSIDELKRTKGLGKTTFENIKGDITVGTDKQEVIQ